MTSASSGSQPETFTDGYRSPRVKCIMCSVAARLPLWASERIYTNCRHEILS